MYRNSVPFTLWSFYSNQCKWTRTRLRTVVVGTICDNHSMRKFNQMEEPRNTESWSEASSNSLKTRKSSATKQNITVEM